MSDKVNILLVDDQPAKLLTYEAILRDLGENLLTANSARDALELLLKNEIALILVDVYMPETDGFELAAMIRDHPRFQKLPIIFISAILLTDVDRLRGYEMGAVDYVPVPVIPEVLRAKVKVFIELFRKTRELEELNRALEQRVAERTSALTASTAQLRQSEQLRGLALVAGQMGSWEWDALRRLCTWDRGQQVIFGVEQGVFQPTLENMKPLIHPEDLPALLNAYEKCGQDLTTYQAEFRVRRPNGELRWCLGTVAASFDDSNRLSRLSGVTVDITERKLAEDRQMLLAQEVDHRARNVVAVVQSFLRLTRANSIEEYIATIDGRIGALSTAHKLLAGSRWEGADLCKLVDEELAPYRMDNPSRVLISGPPILLAPAFAQTVALALHELVTNAAKYGALSTDAGRVSLTWRSLSGKIEFDWIESNGPKVTPPKRLGYGTRVFTIGIERQLGGTVDFQWNEDGLRCKLSIPHIENVKSAGPENVSDKVNSTMATPTKARVKNILLVEDEPTVSMMLADMLSDFGHCVDGPYNRFSDAINAARSNDVHAGVLDVNIGGQEIYAVADVLTERQIPFVFVTGYSVDTINVRFTHVPVLQKPIEPEALRALLH
jgi:two-component sensor histidine kinase/DNA-binding response OmpR family regulator